MAVDYSKGLKVNYPIILLSGLVFVVGSVLTYLLIVKSVFGNYKLSEILPTEENLTMVSAAREHTAAILYSRYTENMLPEGSTWVHDNIDTWESFMKQIKMRYEIIDDQTIELGKLDKYGLLILPGSKSLSDRELINIKKFIEKGGSIFATSGIATFSDEGKWRGWDFFKEVFGMSFTKELEPEEYKSKIHTIRGNLPITAGIPTGYSLNIATWDRPIYAEIRDPRTEQVSFWYDYRSELGLVNDNINKSAGISYGTYGKGRFIWFGFELNSVIGREEARSDENYWTYFSRLVENSVNWLTYLPTAYVNNWPAPYKAAAVFVPVVGKDAQNVKHLNSLLKTKGYPATFFVDPVAAQKDTNIIRSLKSYGEVSTIADIGFPGDNSIEDTTSEMYDKSTQLSNLKASKFLTDNLSGSSAKGFMPRYGYYNNETKQIMNQAGLSYIVTDSITDRSEPKIEIWNEEPVLIINGTARDDYKIIDEYGLKERSFQSYTYEEDIDRLLFEGGLYVLKIHSDSQMKPENIQVVDDVLTYIRNKNIWLTSLEEINSWWNKRGDIEFRYEARSKRRLALEVSNPAGNETDDFIVQVHINKPVSEIDITSDIINTPIPNYQYDKNTQILYLFIDNLEGGESRTLLIDFENVSLL